MSKVCTDISTTYPPSARNAIAPNPFIAWALTTFRAVEEPQKTAEGGGKARLISIPVSHFTEKVRWALDLSGDDYVEDAHPPGMHAHYTLEATKGASTMVPVLVLPDGKVLTDSSDILDFIAEKHPELNLYPAEHKEEIKAFERIVNEKLAPAVRSMAYTIYGKDASAKIKIARVFMSHGSVVENMMAPFVLPVMAGIMTKAFGLSWDRLDEYQKEVMDVFTLVENKLSDGRQYLFGSSFTAADLTFAAIANVLVGVPQMSGVFGQSESYDASPPELEKRRGQLRSTKAGQHCLKVYETCRFPEKHGGDGKVRIKTGKVNKILGYRF
ncbi:unnamed protein product [Vitrella brassicaformis CCMP3155]|uniref:GST N-terminal domain-containing protein n=1 Tax=Vitrella brassicaformis (strain CCMP3155) TaxID=1169540 RepID=A0A0G4FM06_VITBC|nr:unnamed protein product [Vitrella brassicaformis CCMP3155]|eukprot:CEM15049.1 unnamed protein product [Vitrella brassicaformis CCMP3155]